MIIRRTTPDDEFALTQLAVLDSQKPEEGDYLVAVLNGRLVAAVSLTGDQVMADPFEWTADIVAMLEMRAEQLAAPGKLTLASRRRLLARRAAADA